MKTRVISIIAMFLVSVPLFIMGGIVFKLFIYLLSLLALYEIIKLKETKKKLPEFVKFISFILLTLFMLLNNNNVNDFSVSYQIISALFLSYFLPIVFYHTREKYSINDAFYLVGAVFFLAMAFNMFVIMRSVNVNVLIYAFIITTVTDTYAYITGLLIGKNKLLENISPKKTVEGLLGGTFFGVLAGATYYYLVIGNNLPIMVIITITMFLSILGQLGDLFFSAIKRYYGIKDFSNLIPGHGGILDRLDSVIFVLLGIMFLINVL